MPDPEKGTVTIVSACMRPNGLADFALTEVEVTPAEYDNGVHIDLVEKTLVLRGFEEPFIHFSEMDAPSFLLPAVREYLNSSAADTPVHVPA